MNIGVRTLNGRGHLGDLRPAHCLQRVPAALVSGKVALLTVRNSYCIENRAYHFHVVEPQHLASQLVVECWPRIFDKHTTT